MAASNIKNSKRSSGASSTAQNTTAQGCHALIFLLGRTYPKIFQTTNAISYFKSYSLESQTLPAIYTSVLDYNHRAVRVSGTASDAIETSGYDLRLSQDLYHHVRDY